MQAVARTLAVSLLSLAAAFGSAGGVAATDAKTAVATSAARDPKIANALRTTRILVIGSTGRNGGAIMEALEAVGARPRVLVRDLARAKERAGAEVQRDWVVGDLRDAASLEASLRRLRNRARRLCRRLDHRSPDDFHEARKALKAWLGAAGLVPRHPLQPAKAG